MSEKLKAKQKPHYVDNKKFLVAMTEWRLKYDKAEKAKRKRLISQIFRARWHVRDIEN